MFVKSVNATQAKISKYLIPQFRPFLMTRPVVSDVNGYAAFSTTPPLKIYKKNKYNILANVVLS